MDGMEKGREWELGSFCKTRKDSFLNKIKKEAKTLNKNNLYKKIHGGNARHH